MKLLKPVVAGILIGAALFYMPFFVLRVAAVVIVVGALFRLFSGGRFRRGFGHRFHPHFADNIRNMTDEEYKVFKEKHAGPRGEW